MKMISKVTLHIIYKSNVNLIKSPLLTASSNEKNISNKFHVSKHLRIKYHNLVHLHFTSFNYIDFKKNICNKVVIDLIAV